MGGWMHAWLNAWLVVRNAREVGWSKFGVSVTLSLEKGPSEMSYITCVTEWIGHRIQCDPSLLYLRI